MQTVWKFYCGLIKSTLKFKQIIQSGSGVLYKTQCAYESQQKAFCEYLLKHMDNKMELRGDYLMVPDFTALGYVLLNTAKPVSLSLLKCNMSVETIDTDMLSPEDNVKGLRVHTLKYEATEFNMVERKYLKRLIANIESLKCLVLTSLEHESELDAGANLLTSCTALVELRLKKICLDHRTLETVLHRCKNLQILDLHLNVGATEMKILASNLPHCGNLRKLYIYGRVDEKDDEELTISTPTCHCNSLRMLKITDNACIKSGTVQFTGALCHHTNIQYLDLSRNNLGATEAKAIFTGGALQSSLTVLNLSGNRIGKEGAHTISMCFEYWPNLRTLNVSGQTEVMNIGREGAKEITGKLYLCTQLTDLNLAGNCIDNDFTKLVILNLAECVNLTELDLNDNILSIDGTETVRRCATLSWKRSSMCRISVNGMLLHL